MEEVTLCLPISFQLGHLYSSNYHHPSNIWGLYEIQRYVSTTNRRFSKMFSSPVNSSGSVGLPAMFLAWSWLSWVRLQTTQLFKYAFAQQYRLNSSQTSFPCGGCQWNGSATKDPLSPREDLHGVAAKTESWSRPLEPRHYVLCQRCPAVPDIHPTSCQLPALSRAQRLL